MREERATIMPQMELLPPEGDQRVGLKVMRLLEVILKFKADQGLPSKWHRCYELTRNKHWKREPEKGVPLITANLIFRHRTATLAMLTDNNPTFNVRQSGELQEGQEELLETLTHTTEHYWQDNEQQDLLECSVLNGESYGITIEKARFNPDEEYGLGDVVFDLVDPYQFGWYPPKGPFKESMAALHYRPMNIMEARRRWPEMASEILPDSKLEEQIGDNRLDVVSPLGKERKTLWTRIADAVKPLMNEAAGSEEDEDVLVVECWVKDYTRTQEGDMEVDLYPGNIRCVHVCNGGELVLSDVKNPSINWDVLPIELAAKTYLFHRFPFNVAVSIKDNVNQWGVTDLEHLNGIQEEINKTLSQQVLVKDKVSRIKVINPETSGVPNSAFTNKPGIINPRNHMVADSIRYLEPPKLPPEMGELLNVYMDLFFKVSGSFEFEQARDSKGTLAYQSIATLLEHVATLLRGKLRNYQKLIRERGRMYISLAQNWYVEDRWISYSQDGQDIATAVRGMDLIIPAKLTVVSGSTMPVSKIQQREEALRLYEMGAIDIYELLKSLDWKNWREVATRMQMGPVGVFIEKLAALGLPPQLVQLFQEVAQMDDKEFEKALKSGQLPSINQLLLPAPEGTDPNQDAEVGVKHAQIEKLRAETQLIMEKIRTEQVEQNVKMAGVELDNEMMKIKRAETVNNIRSRKADEELKQKSLETNAGLQQQKMVADSQARDKEFDTDAKLRQKEFSTNTKLREKEIAAKSAEKKDRGYIEKGMKSNNKGGE
jgi:hypothetical protein